MFRAFTEEGMKVPEDLALVTTDNSILTRTNSVPLTSIAYPYISDLRQELLRDDQTIPGIRNEDPGDLARKATVLASSCQEDSRDIGPMPVRRIPLNMDRSVMIPAEGGKTIKTVGLYL